MPEPIRCLGRVFPYQIRRGVAAVAGRNRAVGRLEPAVELLLHDVAVGAGRRVVSEVGPTLGISEGINADADGNTDNHSKQDALDHARFHLCFRFPTMNDQSLAGKMDCWSPAVLDFKWITLITRLLHFLRSLHFQPHSNGLNFLNHLPSINSGPEQVEGNGLNYSVTASRRPEPGRIVPRH